MATGTEVQVIHDYRNQYPQNGSERNVLQEVLYQIDAGQSDGQCHEETKEPHGHFTAPGPGESQKSEQGESRHGVAARKAGYLTGVDPHPFDQVELII